MADFGHTLRCRSPFLTYYHDEKIAPRIVVPCELDLFQKPLKND